MASLYLFSVYKLFWKWRCTLQMHSLMYTCTLWTIITQVRKLSEYMNSTETTIQIWKQTSYPSKPQEYHATYKQINFIFKDNVRILCLSGQIKKSKITAKVSKNSWNKIRSNRFHWCHLWRQRVYCYRFLISFYINRVPEMLY